MLNFSSTRAFDISDTNSGTVEFVGLILLVSLCREILRLTMLDFGQKCPLSDVNEKETHSLINEL